jgi:hypothetical protein
MALTLIEAAGYIEDQAQRAVVELYAQNTPLLGALPFMDAPQGVVKFPREADLGTADFRSLNAAYTEDSGNVEWVTESCFNLGGDVDVDTRLVRTGQIDLRAQQEMMKIKATALKFDNAFVKGDPSSDADSFAGLQARLVSTDQEVDMGTAALSLTKLDQAIDTCENPTHIYMSKAMRRRLTAAGRNTSVGGYITRGEDAFGRKITMYQDLPILESDVFGHTSAPLSAFDEASSTTSIYVLSLTTNGLMGLQVSPPEMRDLGEIDTKPVERSRIEWFCGLALMSPRAAVRLKGITDSAVVA